MSLFEIRKEPLSLEECVRAVQRNDAGGIATFLGVVRDHDGERQVTSLWYEAYESMANQQMAEIGDEIATEIPGVRLAVLHRVGELRVGEIAVVCAASAAHREEAFRACRALIDRIKERVPIWKREHDDQGAHWVT